MVTINYTLKGSETKIRKVFTDRLGETAKEHYARWKLIHMFFLKSLSIITGNKIKTVKL